MSLFSLQRHTHIMHAYTPTSSCPQTRISIFFLDSAANHNNQNVVSFHTQTKEGTWEWRLWCNHKEKYSQVFQFRQPVKQSRSQWVELVPAHVSVRAKKHFSPHSNWLTWNIDERQWLPSFLLSSKAAGHQCDLQSRKECTQHMPAAAATVTNSVFFLGSIRLMDACDGSNGCR